MPKNFRIIPPAVRRQLTRIEDDRVQVAAIKLVTRADLQSGRFAALGIPLAGACEVVPPASAGRQSRRNVEGHVIVRRDLPKEPFYVSVETPNWGDWSNGTHTVTLSGMRYPREFMPPSFTPIRLELLKSTPDGELYRFAVGEIIQRRDEARLLVCLNLLQENVGSVQVFGASEDFAAYEQSLQVHWEFLPPGEREKLLRHIMAGRPRSAQERRVVEERAKFIESLKPKQWLYGASGFARYWGAQFADDLVVFEHEEHGNALYVMYEDWAQLSQRSRVELLSGRFGHNFDRIVHTGNWQEKLVQILDKRLPNRS